MRSYMIGPSEMEAEMFEATCYSVAMDAAKRSFGRNHGLQCFGCWNHEVVL